MHAYIRTYIHIHCTNLVSAGIASEYQTSQ